MLMEEALGTNDNVWNIDSLVFGDPSNQRFTS